MIIVYMLGWYVFDKRDSKWPQWITLIVLFLYLLDVLWITVLRGDHLIRPTMIVIPFYAYYRIIITGWYSYGMYIVMGLIGNMLLFVPLGILVSQMLNCRHNLKIALLIGFIFSLFIECFQYKTMVGTFEMDDLIQNAWESVIGCGIGNIVSAPYADRKDRLGKNLSPLIVWLILLGGCSIYVYMFRRA